MKKIFLLSLVLVSFVLIIINSSCKKKKDDVVAPAPVVPTASASITFGTTPKATFTPVVSNTTGDYLQYKSDFTSLNVDFTTSTGSGSAKPTANTTVNLATSTLVTVDYIDANGDDWSATSGTLTVTVNQGFVTSSFTNLTFYNNTTAATNTSNSGSITTN
jgi:hypothetical protein